MNTARILIPTIALSAGGLAAYPASGLGDKPLPPEAIALQTVDVLVAKSGIGLGRLGHTVTAEAVRARQSGTLSLALRSIADVNATETRCEDQPAKRGETIKVVRYGVSSPTTIQK